MSRRKKGLSDEERIQQESRLSAFLEEAEVLRDRMEGLVERDAACFQRVVDSWGASRSGSTVSPAEKTAALKECVETSLALCQMCCEGLFVAQRLLDCLTSTYLESDLGVACELMRGAFNASGALIDANLRSIGEEAYTEAVLEKLRRWRPNEEEATE